MKLYSLFEFVTEINLKYDICFQFLFPNREAARIYVQMYFSSSLSVFITPSLWLRS